MSFHTPFTRVAKTAAPDDEFLAIAIVPSGGTSKKSESLTFVFPGALKIGMLRGGVTARASSAFSRRSSSARRCIGSRGTFLGGILHLVEEQADVVDAIVGHGYGDGCDAEVLVDLQVP